MLLIANGMKLHIDDWAQRLGVDPYAITNALANGASMQDVVDVYTCDTFDAPSNAPYGDVPTRGLMNAALNAPRAQTHPCAACASRAADFYDMVHAKHLDELTAEREAGLQREREQWELYVQLNTPVTANFAKPCNGGHQS